jgi:hypothetical protein
MPIQLDLRRVAGAIARILHAVYVERRTAFSGAAAERGIALEALAAAAITGMLREEFDANPRPRPRPTRQEQPRAMVLPFRALACRPHLAPHGPSLPSA